LFIVRFEKGSNGRHGKTSSTSSGFVKANIRRAKNNSKVKKKQSKKEQRKDTNSNNNLPTYNNFLAKQLPVWCTENQCVVHCVAIDQTSNGHHCVATFACKKICIPDHLHTATLKLQLGVIVIPTSCFRFQGGGGIEPGNQFVCYFETGKESTTLFSVWKQKQKYPNRLGSFSWINWRYLVTRRERFGSFSLLLSFFFWLILSCLLGHVRHWINNWKRLFSFCVFVYGFDNFLLICGRTRKLTQKIIKGKSMVSNGIPVVGSAPSKWRVISWWHLF